MRAETQCFAKFQKHPTSEDLFVGPRTLGRSANAVQLRESREDLRCFTVTPNCLQRF